MGNKTLWALLVAALVPTFIVAGFWQPSTRRSMRRAPD